MPAEQHSGRRGRPEWVTLITTALAALLFGAGGGYLIGHRTATATTPGRPIESAAGAILPSGRASAAAGDSIALKGANGEDIVATLIKVDDPAVATHNSPAAGTHFASAEIRLDNHGPTAWNGNGAPTIGASLIDAAGQRFGPVLASTTTGQMFTAHVVIEPGGTALGTVTFQIANGAKPASVQIVLDDGSGPVAQWQLS